MIDQLTAELPNLSTSKVAEWRLLLYVVAGAIHLFEAVLDVFGAEIEKKAYANTAGTVAWYREMSLRFQYGHELAYDADTGFYGYAVEDTDAQFVKVVAVVEKPAHLFIKVAKQDAEGRIIPLSDVELQAFVDYWRTMRIGGTEITIVSTTADTIRYNLEVYYDPAVARETAETNVTAALENFKTSLSFDAMFYPQRLIDAVMNASGVVTVNPVSIEHKATADEGFAVVSVREELASGYFDYAEDNTLILISTRE